MSSESMLTDGWICPSETSTAMLTDGWVCYLIDNVVVIPLVSGVLEVLGTVAELFNISGHVSVQYGVAAGITIGVISSGQISSQESVLGLFSSTKDTSGEIT